MNTKGIVAGALALEFSDVILLVGGVLIIGVGLYLMEKSLEGELADALAPIKNFANNLSGPADGQTWSDYLFGSN